MKRIITIVLSISTSIQVLNAQSVPQRINYQALIRDAAGRYLTQKPLTFKIEVTDSLASVVYFSERHTVTSDRNGAVSISIGSGILIAGSMSGIPWSTGKKFLRTCMDTLAGNNFSLLGST